jgi:hypothetical protein
MSKIVSNQFSKSWVFMLILFWIPFSLFCQKIDHTFLEPDDGEKFVSVYLTINDLSVSKLNSKIDEFDTISQVKKKKAIGKFNYFGFKITANTIWYDDRKKSLFGNFISYYFVADTLHFVMSEKNGDILFIEITQLNKEKKSVVIRENKLNGKTFKYYSENCILERRSS